MHISNYLESTLIQLLGQRVKTNIIDSQTALQNGGTNSTVVYKSKQFH